MLKKLSKTEQKLVYSFIIMASGLSISAAFMILNTENKAWFWPMNIIFGLIFFWSLGRLVDVEKK